MLGKTLTYKDFNGQEVEDTFYFNFTPAEVLELNIRQDIEAVGKSGNPDKIMDTFKRVLKAAYGVRINGGAKFIKPEDAWLEFVSGPAYSQIFMSLVTDAAYASAFMSELIPPELATQAEELKAKAALSSSELARANSEANFQSHLKPSQGADVPTSRREALAQENPPQQ